MGGDGAGRARRLRGKLRDFPGAAWGMHTARPQPPEPRMIRSMTAFASGERATPWGALGCELRSVNHRFLELGVRLPERSEEHTSELQSQSNLVCRLLLEKKKKNHKKHKL